VPDLSGHGDDRSLFNSPGFRGGTGEAQSRSRDAINSKAPLGKLVGTSRPTDFCITNGAIPAIPIWIRRAPLAVHGMTAQATRVTVDDLMRMPSISRTVFIECTGKAGKMEKGGPQCHCPKPLMVL